MPTMYIRISYPEEEGFQLAADLAGMNMSSWTRVRLRAAAEFELKARKQPVPFLPPEPEVPKKVEPAPKPPKPPGKGSVEALFANVAPTAFPGGQMRFKRLAGSQWAEDEGAHAALEADYCLRFARSSGKFLADLNAKESLFFQYAGDWPPELALPPSAPAEPVPDERLPFEAWIRPYTNGGQKFPEADEELGGHWCFAILLARDCYDPAIYEEIETAYRAAWHEGKTPGPDETP